MCTEKGFTLYELLIVIVVAAVLGTLAVNRFNSYSAHTRLETTAYFVLKDISTVRLLAFKRDADIKVTFSDSSYQVFVDDDANGIYDASEMVRTFTLPPPLRFQLPSNPPTSAPAEAALPDSGQNVGADWDSLGLIVNNDALGNVNRGSVYISSPNLPEITFCMRVSDRKQNFKIFKWTGSSWIAP
ncbi:MAG: pilus assembly FimT family protein [Fibrobacterota bacterium]